MDRKEVRNWYKLLIQEDKSNEENIIQFMLENFGADAGEQMKTIIKEENLIQIDNMNRKLAELENNSDSDSDEVFYSKKTIEKFEVREEDKIWK